MTTIFTQIIQGAIPSRMIWEDDVCVSFLDVRPLAPGHALVVPVQECDLWTDLEPDVIAHITGVARTIGRAQMSVFTPERVGLMIAGFEVPHTHLHVVPINTMAQLDFSQAELNPHPGSLDEHLASLRHALEGAGHSETISRR